MGAPLINVELSITNRECCERSAKEVLKIIRPKWQQKAIQFEVYTAGITNKIMSAFVDPSEKLVFRIFGKNTENFIDRDRELIAMEKLSNNGLAAPLYARFTNGIVCGYLKGTTITADELKNLEMQRRICSTIAAYHNMDAPGKATDDLFPFRKTRDFIKNIDVPAAEKVLHFASHLSDNLAEIQSLIVPLNEEVTFCHNDILVHNIIYDKSSGKVLFIDYEYADFNYAIFDLANHFCEFAGVDNPDYTKCPNEEEMRSFICLYLQARHGNVDESRLQNLLRRVSLFQALAHLLWSAWSVVQSQNSTLDFDYVSYASIRYEQYLKCLQNYKSHQQH